MCNKTASVTCVGGGETKRWNAFVRRLLKQESYKNLWQNGRETILAASSCLSTGLLLPWCERRVLPCQDRGSQAGCQGSSLSPPHPPDAAVLGKLPVPMFWQVMWTFRAHAKSHRRPNPSTSLRVHLSGWLKLVFISNLESSGAKTIANRVNSDSSTPNWDISAPSGDFILLFFCNRACLLKRDFCLSLKLDCVKCRSSQHAGGCFLKSQ